VSWFWLLFFLVLSGMAVGAPLFLASPQTGESAAAEPFSQDPAEALTRRRQIEDSLSDLDLDLGAGKVTAEEHAAARAALLAELAA
jgi:hypothetical protein